MPLVIWRKFSFMSSLLRAFIIYRCDYMVFLFTYLFLIQHSPILHNLWCNLSALNSLVAFSALVSAVQSSKYPAQPQLSIRSGYPHILLPLLSPCTAPPLQCPACTFQPLQCLGPFSTSSALGDSRSTWIGGSKMPWGREMEQSWGSLRVFPSLQDHNPVLRVVQCLLRI